MSLLIETLTTAKDVTHRKLAGRAMETATYTGKGLAGPHYVR
jgi:hypothetical protein